MRLRRCIPGLVGLLLAVGTAATVPAGPAAAAPAEPVLMPLGSTNLPPGFKAIEVDVTSKRVFVSSAASHVVTVLGYDGQVQASIPVPGAGALLVDGGTLYVASTTGGRIDAFNTATLAPIGSYGGGALLKPHALVKAGGRLWTTTGDCFGGGVQLVSIAPTPGTITTHPALDLLAYCPFLFTSPVEPNVIFGFDRGLSPTTVVRLDISSGAPVATGSLRTDGGNGKDAEVFPDGQTFGLASGAPYEIRTFRTNPIEPFGIVYPTGAYPNALDSTAGAGGVVAAGRDSPYDPDIDVFRLGDPSKSFLRYDFGSSTQTLKDGGLALSPEGSHLFAVSGHWDGDTATLSVFGPPPEGGRYHPLPPARILDTRTGGAGGPLGPQASVDVAITGQGGVPSTGVSAVAMNVTVTQPTAISFLTLYPAGTVRPLASNLNYTAGKTVPNLVVVKVGAGGKVSMYNEAGSADVILDIAGWFSDPVTGTGDEGRYTALVPARILDTREGAVRLGPGQALDLQVAGRGGVPATGAKAAVLNVVATGPTATSFVTVYPAGEARPLASNLNFNAGDTVSNRLMVKLGADGKVSIYNLAGSTDIVVDVGGWYNDASVAPARGTYTPVIPARILDTRDGPYGPLNGGTAIAVQVTGRGGLPTSGVSAVILNATVVRSVGPGFLTIFPAGGNRPLASDVTFSGDETRPNLTVVQVGVDGKVILYASTRTDVIFDVAGWMS